MSARAGIVVTGTEVLTGRVRDRNGPWLADRLLELGVDLAHITICGDRPEDMAAQLRFMAGMGMDLVITSGGLGPTADDLTMQVVAEFAGRRLALDERLEERIAAIVAPLMSRWRGIDPEAVRLATRKQATVPEGAELLQPVGTAPGAVVASADGSRPTVVVLPGPPRELHGMWPAALETEAFRAAVAGRAAYDQHMLRLFGIPESEIAETLRVAEEAIGREFAQLEITTCLRRAELEVVVRHEAGGADAWRRLLALIEDRHADTLFSTDGSSIEEQVAALLAGRRIAVAESCTGGLLAARLTERPGSSDYVMGGVVSYSNESKAQLLGVDPDLIARHGAVSPEVANAMAGGALARFGADTAIAITGVAGPGGGTEAKPVGYVCWSLKTADGRVLARDIRLPGDRAEVRDRSTTVALHLLRRLLRGERTHLSEVRLFVALDIPERARERIVAWRSRAIGDRDDLRVVADASLHVTLVFVGERAEGEAGAIGAAMAAAVATLPAPRLRAAWVQPVPRRRPRLLALEIEDAGGRAAAVQSAVAEALGAAGLHTPERRAFWPHVTFARVARGAGRVRPVALPPPDRPFTAAAVTLYRSHSTPRGSPYEALRRERLRRGR